MLTQFRFRFKGKDLGVEKLEIIKEAGDKIEDDDILYAFVNSKGEHMDYIDWVGDAIDCVNEVNNPTKEDIADATESKDYELDINVPWHIQIVYSHNSKPISKARFSKLFGAALLLEKKEV